MTGTLLISARRAAALTALAAALGAAAGCGSSKSTTSSTAKTAPAGASGAAPSQQVGQSQPVAFARAVNATAADLPGWSETKAASEKVSSASGDKRLRSCLGAPPKQVPEFKSAQFSRLAGKGQEQIKSSTEVMRSAAEAAAEAARLRGPQALTCLRSIAPSLAGGAQRSRFGPFQITRLPAPAGVQGGFALRLATTVSGPQSPRPVPVYLDEYGAVAGRALLGVSTVGFPRPVPAATAEALLAKLAQRAASHNLPE